MEDQKLKSIQIRKEKYDLCMQREVCKDVLSTIDTCPFLATATYGVTEVRAILQQSGYIIVVNCEKHSFANQFSICFNSWP